MSANDDDLVLVGNTQIQPNRQWVTVDSFCDTYALNSKDEGSRDVDNEGNVCLTPSANTL